MPFVIDHDLHIHSALSPCCKVDTQTSEVKIGFSLQNSYVLPMVQALPLLRQTGFDAISPVWQADSQMEIIATTAAKCGLTLQSLHGQLRGIPYMWSREEAESSKIFSELMAGLYECDRYGFPIMVVHPWTGFDYDFDPLTAYYGNFDRLMEQADKLGIRIAFENLEGPEFLYALLGRYPQAGFCWDSGHQQCYDPDTDFLGKFGHRLIMTHLNDNFGITGTSLTGDDDLHLIPGDGIADWQENVRRLQKAQAQEILNFELKIRPRGDRCVKDLYSHLPLEEFFRQAATQARAIADAYCP